MIRTTMMMNDDVIRSAPPSTDIISISLCIDGNNISNIIVLVYLYV